MTYEQSEQYLLNIPKFTKKNPLENTKKYLQLLGEMVPDSDGKPQNFAEMKNVIHVAGTNGKGSVCAYLGEILREAGYCVGLFTSPHLISMTERFRIDNIPITEQKFLEIFEQIKICTEAMTAKGEIFHPTFFEFLVAMAFVLFSKEQVDYLILETGMGGRLDATNVIKKPLVTVITSIGYDHMQYLGDSIRQIAAEKAGIIKEGVPVIYDAAKEEVCKIIEEKADQFHAKTYPVSLRNYEILNFSKKKIDFLLKSEYYNDMQVSLQTCALYQIINAALAAVTIQNMDTAKYIPKTLVCHALGQMRWQGRMEWLSDAVLIDGAHNEDGMIQAVNTLQKLGRPVILLYAAVQDKNYKKMIQMLCENLPLQAVVVVRLNSSRSADEKELYRIFKRYFKGSVYKETDTVKALDTAIDIQEHSDTEGVIFCTGSLYFVGELKQCIT